MGDYTNAANGGEQNIGHNADRTRIKQGVMFNTVKWQKWGEHANTCAEMPPSAFESAGASRDLSYIERDYKQEDFQPRHAYSPAFCWDHAARAPAGGCLGGTWRVVATPDKAFAGVVTRNTDGEASDTFVVEQRSSVECSEWNLDVIELFKVSSSGTKTKLKNLGCNNKEYTLEQTFFCTEGCDAIAGFVADQTASSGCRLDSNRIGHRVGEDGDTAQGHTALVFGIICGCMVLIAVLGCVYVAWRKKRDGAAQQVMQSKKCNPDDLERADQEMNQETNIERPQPQAHAPSSLASGFEPAEPAVSGDLVAVELPVTQGKRLRTQV